MSVFVGVDGFPGLRAVWDDPTSVSALAVLRKARTADVAGRLGSETFGPS